jgi:phospholipase/lecithinase/hemolysin
VRVSAHSSGAAPALLILALAACSPGADDAPPQNATAPPAPRSPGPQPLPVPSSLFVFGDSLSDVGNAAAAADYLLNVPLDPPTVGLCNPTDVLVTMRGCDDLFYRRSRVSNAPVAVEHLATRLGLGPLKPSLHVLPNQARDGTVYAVASAKAGGVANEDLARQVDWLLLGRGALPADAVYVVMIGGNDAIDALQAEVAGSKPGAAPSAAIVTAAVDAIGSEVERLLDFGARRLVVANVPDLSELPAVRATARASADEARVLATASAISAAFNRALAAKLDEVEAGGSWLPPTPVIARFDLHAALSAARQAMAANGANTSDACFDTELYRSSSAAERAFHPDCAPVTADGAPRFDEFVFFDGIHPTGATHAALGDALGTSFQ